jgi:predicted HicB family RNase H-like nuclease
MTKKKMTRTEEHGVYANPDNQEPQGPAHRRKGTLTELVPVRFPPETLERLRAAADADDRSVSSWIRQAVEHELDDHHQAS